MNADPGQTGVILEIGNGMSGHNSSPDKAFKSARP
jgi:hypothetical protein